MKEKFPRLSKDLPHKEARGCQNCNWHAFAYWQEHDDNDQGEPIFIKLCRACSDKLIEPHPRLYRQIELFEVFPGTMKICSDCVHMGETQCKSPLARFNGGKGLDYTYPPAARGFIDGTRKGKRFGGPMIFWSGPCTACTGKNL